MPHNQPGMQDCQVRANYPAPPSATPYRDPGPSAAGMLDSAMPFRPGSWETMTNIEKFDELRSQLKIFADKNERMGNDLYKLQGLLEQHRHSTLDGSVLVQYNRDRF